MRLEDMVLFVEVAKARSFRRAAEALKMPSSTLSRRISAFEAGLGMRLIHRTTRKLELTDCGRVYFERAQAVVDDARRIHEDLAELHAEISGLIRVSLPSDYALTYLSSVIADFVRLNQRIRLELDLTPRNADMIMEPFDLAIRMRPMPNSQMIARLLTTLTPHLYASPSYLEKVGTPRHPSDLRNHQCIEFPQVDAWSFRRGEETARIAIDGNVRPNSPGMAKRFAALGLGLVLIPDRLVTDEVALGQLQRILPDWEGEAAPVYIVTESKLLPARVQHFIAFLRDHAGGGSHSSTAPFSE
jgi:DNA-binding transcriptional LysR family regulator